MSKPRVSRQSSLTYLHGRARHGTVPLSLVGNGVRMKTPLGWEGESSSAHCNQRSRRWRLITRVRQKRETVSRWSRCAAVAFGSEASASRDDRGKGE